MNLRVRIPFSLLLLAITLVAGCRLGRYDLTEPLDGQTFEVKSGDRISVVLEENVREGYRWMPSCEDGDVSFARETLDPDKNASITAPRKVRIIIRVHRGFDEIAHVTLRHCRPGRREKPARQIDLMLHRKVEDTVPWK